MSIGPTGISPQSTASAFVNGRKKPIASLEVARTIGIKSLHQVRFSGEPVPEAKKDSFWKSSWKVITTPFRWIASFFKWIGSFFKSKEAEKLAEKPDNNKPSDDSKPAPGSSGEGTERNAPKTDQPLDSSSPQGSGNGIDPKDKDLQRELASDTQSIDRPVESKSSKQKDRVQAEIESQAQRLAENMKTANQIMELHNRVVRPAYLDTKQEIQYLDKQLEQLQQLERPHKFPPSATQTLHQIADQIEEIEEEGRKKGLPVGPTQSTPAKEAACLMEQYEATINPEWLDPTPELNLMSEEVEKMRQRHRE